MNKKQMTFGTYRLLHSKKLIAIESENELKQAPCPSVLCGAVIPEDLNQLTMNQLTDLTAIKEGNEVEAIRVIAGIDPKRLDTEPAVAVIGFANFITRELIRIAGLFKQLKTHHTSAELQAGADQLDFGIFGTIDWYARRMGITDHDEVMSVEWLKVWQCAKIDKENHEYQQRYSKIISQQQ